MTTEEKAKAYDEAIKKAKEIKEKIVYSHLSTESCKAVSEYIDTIIPELRESEDDKHRKWILEYLYDGLRKADEQFKDHFKSAINWFEKQKEQKCLPGFDDMAPEEKMNHPLYLEGFDVGREVGKVEAEQKPAWSEEDERILKGIIGKIDHDQTYGVSKAEMLSFLEGLRPSWKPSGLSMVEDGS